MHPILSTIGTILIIIIALRLGLKATGCLIKIIVLILAAGIIIVILNSSYHFITPIFGITSIFGINL